MLYEVINHLDTKPVKILTTDEFKELLNEVDLIEEKETYFRDKIRILSTKKFILVQEKSNKDEIVIRKVNTLKDGLEFIQNRLVIYENMWNGCGCKIDYYK